MSVRLSLDDALKILEAIRPATEALKDIASRNPIVKDESGRRDVCHYCRAEVMGTDDVVGQPIIAHAKNCPYLTATRIRLDNGATD